MRRLSQGVREENGPVQPRESPRAEKVLQVLQVLRERVQERGEAGEARKNAFDERRTEVRVSRNVRGEQIEGRGRGQRRKSPDGAAKSFVPLVLHSGTRWPVPTATGSSKNTSGQINST